MSETKPVDLKARFDQIEQTEMPGYDDPKAIERMMLAYREIAEDALAAHTRELRRLLWLLYQARSIIECERGLTENETQYLARTTRLEIDEALKGHTASSLGADDTALAADQGETGGSDDKG